MERALIGKHTIFKRINSLQLIDDKVNLLKYRIQDNELSSQEWYSYVGELEAIEDLYDKKHKALLKEIRIANEDRKKLEKNSLFQTERVYLDGYINGIEFLLNTNRSSMHKPQDLRLRCLCPDENLALLLSKMFEHFGFENTPKLKSGLCCYFSCDVEELNRLVTEPHINEHIIVFDAFRKIPKITSKKYISESDESILEIKNKILENGSISKEFYNNYNFNLLKLDISKVSFVVIETVINIDKIVKKVISSLKI
mgnify:CR=1 FL=1